jgi:PTH1 family peptidyl-tRNA hydrolase
MKLICGLGNPEDKYTRTRHNVGFRAVDLMAKLWEFPAFENKGKYLLSTKGEGDRRVFLMKPLTYMNLSGEAVSDFLNYYKLNPQDLTVVYDDVDLPLGKIRFRDSGSAGTHNGMKSIIEQLATLDFPRMRIGIESRGEIAPEQMDLHTFVLAPFLPDEEPLLEAALKEAVTSLEKSLA